MRGDSASRKRATKTSYADLSDQSFDDCEETDIRKLRDELKILREENRELRSDLAEGQSRCEEVLATVAQAQKIHHENAALRQQVNEHNAQRESLVKRLEICTQANADLTARLEQSRNFQELSQKNEISSLEDEIRTLHSHAEADIAQRQEKIRELNEAMTRAQADCSLARTQLMKLVNVAEGYFRVEFKNPAALIEFLLHPSAHEVAPVSTDHSAERKLKKAKGKLEGETNYRKQLELEILQLRQSLQTEVLNREALLTEFQDCVRTHAADVQKMEEQHEQAVSALRAQLKQSSTMRSISTQVIPLDDEVKGSLLREKLDVTAELKHANDTISQLHNRIGEQAAMIEELTHATEKKQNKTERQAKELKDAHRTIRQLETDLEAASASRRLCESQQLQITELQKRLSGETTKLNRALALANSEMASQENELKAAVSERNRLVAIVDQQWKLLEKADKTIAARPAPAEASFPIPIEQESIQWDFGTLPDDLIALLRGACDADGFPMSARLRTIFAIISKWITTLEVRHSTELRREQDARDDQQQDFNQFAGALMEVLEKRSLSTNDIISEVEQLQKTNLRLQQDMHEFQSDRPVIFDQVTYSKLQGTIAALQDENNQLSKKAKRQRSELRERKTAFHTICRQREADIQTLRAECERAQATIEQLHEEVTDLQDKNGSLRREISECQSAKDAENERSTAEFDAMLSEQATRFEELRVDSSTTIFQQKEAIAQLEGRVLELTESVRKVTRQLADSKEECDDLSQKLTESQLRNRKLERKVHDGTGRVDTVSDTEIEPEAKPPGLEQGAVQEGQKDETIRRLTTQVERLELALKRSVSKSQSRIDRLEREKKVIEMQGKAKLMSCETEHTVQLGDLQRQWESEKLSLYAFLAEQFHVYFDPSHPLDDQEFRQIVGRIKNEFERQQKQELAYRKLVKAREGQTTAEALLDVVFAARDPIGGSSARSMYERRP
jgi:chromosome segregation ATPase